MSDKPWTAERYAPRFWSKVDQSGGPEACWPWLASAGPRGYGMARWGGFFSAHRVSYTLAVGPIPEGLTIDHLCRNRICVNPAHLEPVTRRENTQRAFPLRTECFRGHPFDVANTYWNKDGRQECRACHTAYEVARKRRLGVKPTRRLTDDQCREARRLLDQGWTQKQVGARFGVYDSTISRAVRRIAA